jgi:putative ABC transport system permease protein
MFRNYLLVTFRNLLKNKVFTIINIVGLGVGLSVCIVAFFNHMFNYEFDRTHENYDEIYRINCFRDMQGREQEYGFVPATLGLEIKNDIPGIIRASRFQRTNSPVKVEDNMFQAQISFVDPDFLQIFTLPSVRGDTKSIPGSGDILLSETMAHTLFSDDDPLGNSISIFNDKSEEFTYTVCAVFEDFPDNSSFRIDIIGRFDNFLSMWNVDDANWRLFISGLFIQVPDKSIIPSITRSLADYIAVQNRVREDFRINRFSLVPLKNVGSNTRNIWGSSLFPSLHPAALFAPPIMAVFILLIACFNFANTSVAAFSKRLKEIGLRKTYGGQRKQLLTQFMLETLIICLFALFIGIALAYILVPAYSNLWAYMTIKLTFGKYGIFWIFLLFLLFLTGFLSGVYPALHVSSFNPVYVFRGATLFRGSGKLSVILMTSQFTFSIIALVMGLVFTRNADYQRTLDLGYDRDKIIVVPVPPEISLSLKNEILANPQVISAGGTYEHIGWGSYRRSIDDSEKQLEVAVLDIGPEYAQTMGLRLVEGRLFDKTRMEADISNNSVVVNQKLVSDFSWENAVGKTVTLYDTTRINIIGVVEDFYISGVWNKIEPTMLRIVDNSQHYNLAVRAEPENIPAVLDYISQKWKELVPNQIFNGIAQEDTMQEEKDINDSIMKVCVFLAIVAIIMSLIGMYNMVSLDIIKRTKEVGIRKIQGATIPILMFLLSRKYLVVLIIAAILGCTGGYFMSGWLMDSIWDYYVDINAGIMIISTLIMFAATLLTITTKVFRAARRNPAVSLRYE